MEKRVALSRARRELTALLRWVRQHHGRVVITRKRKAIGTLVLPSPSGRYTLTIQPAGDDALIPLPEALLAELGWTVGDYLVLDRSDAGGIALRRVDKREPL